MNVRSLLPIDLESDRNCRRASTEESQAGRMPTSCRSEMGTLADVLYRHRYFTIEFESVRNRPFRTGRLRYSCLDCFDLLQTIPVCSLALNPSF
jgi:hypothetical protein